MAGLDRRSVLASGAALVGAGAGAGLTGAGLLPGTAAAAAAQRTGLDDPALLRRIRYRGDDGLFFWWIRGEYLAAIGSELTPLYGMAYGSIQRVTTRPDGGFDMRQLELAFRTDLTTGARIGAFTNPVTGRGFAMPFAPLGPTTVRYSDRAIPSVPREFHGSTIDFAAFPGTAYAVGDTLFVPYRAASRVTTPGRGTRIVNDIATFQAPLASALDPQAGFVPATMFCSDLTSFPAWLGMGDQPGSLVMRGHGAKVADVRAMPDNWQAMVHAFDPSILADPAAALDRAPTPYAG